MVILNDVGLTLEIMGFVIFLFVPLQETWNLELNTGKTNTLKKISDYFGSHHKTRYILRYGGIGLIILGLIMQYGFLQ